jgi:hypothetical protein
VTVFKFRLGISLGFDAFKEDAQGLVSRGSFLDSYVLPDYDQFNIANIGSVIGKIFSVKPLVKKNLPNDCVDDYSGVEKVVLFIIDGLGYNRLISHMNKTNGAFNDLANRGVLKAFTSTFPSTTSTALTSIFTGSEPSQHGVVGFNIFVPEFGLIFNTLDMQPVIGHSSGIDLAEFFSRNSLPWLPLLLDSGIKVKTFTRRNLVGSGLSRLIHRHQELFGYALASDMVVQVRKALEQPGPLFLCVYYAGFDTLEHAYGPNSEETSAELQYLENLLKGQLFERLSAETKQKTMLLVTADHGVVETLQTNFLNDPGVTDRFLIPPTGDMRATYFFPKYGQENKLKETLSHVLQGFNIVSSKDLVDKGAFGAVNSSNRLHTLTGALTALSYSKNIVLYPYRPGERPQIVKGAHGGMTPEEMLVPLLSAKLSKI